MHYQFNCCTAKVIYWRYKICEFFRFHKTLLASFILASFILADFFVIDTQEVKAQDRHFEHFLQ